VRIFENFALIILNKYFT
jgi:hypothetical protein